MWGYFDKRARRLGILDVKLAQTAAIFFALTIAKLFPQIMQLSIWWFVCLAILSAIRPFITFYRNSIEPAIPENVESQK